MRVIWSSQAWEDYILWQEPDPRTVRKINALIKDAGRDPFRGLVKPEPLREDWQDWWSRRITDEHRLIYRVLGRGNDRSIEIARCRRHYDH
jgi:toxin YoeB